MNEQDNIYEVYEVTYKGKVVYIGQGIKNRSMHAMSGASHNPGLNKLFFEDPTNMSVLVLREGLSKDEALETELSFILASEPELNIQHNPNKKKVKKFRKYTI